MATVNETRVDAAASADTSYSMTPGDTFTGRLGERFDEDWIRIELQEGLTYEINLTGDGPGAAADTILQIYNDAGQQVAMNDDVDLEAGNLFSMLNFTPESSGTYYISAGSYTANPSQENWGDYRIAVSNPGGSDPMEEDSDMVGEDSNLVEDNAEGNEGDIDDLSNDYIFVIEGNFSVIRGTSGVDGLTGSADDDAIYGSLGADTIQGGPGYDIILYVDSDAGVEVRLDDGTARGGHAEGDTFPGRQTIEYRNALYKLQQVEVLDIEGLVGSVHDDILVGAESNNLLLGGPGNDELDGREGDDLLDGQEGDDVLVGGLGLDLLIGGTGNDTVSYEDRSGDFIGELTANLSSGESRVSGIEMDWFPGRQVVEYLDEDENIQQAEVSDIENLRGSQSGDTLTGAQGPNRLEGLGGYDYLYGLAGNDVLLGGAGGDRLEGGLGNDFLDGGEDNDILDGGAHFDMLFGGAGEDELAGGAGDDELDGGAGDDILDGGPGADVLRGGPGIDVADYFWHSNAGVVVNLHTAAARGGDAEGDRFAGQQVIEYVDASGNAQQAQISDIENLRGSEHDDVLTGDRGANELNGAGGDDVLEGREGDDRLLGDDPWLSFWRDSVPGDDRLDGGEGNDWLEGGGGADQFQGGPGEDTVSYRYSGNYMGVEVRLYDGTARNEDAEGDTFVGMKTIDYVDSEGNRQEIMVPDIENLFGSAGNDILAGAYGPNRLDGYEGNDRLFGREGDDWLEGGEGWDTLEGGPGADVLRGGPDFDSASYASSDAGVVVRLHTVLEQRGKGGDAEGDTYNSETYAFTGEDGTTREFEVPDILNLIGSEHNDVLAGDFRENWINGLGGDDLLYGGPDGGPDILVGGDGDDKVYGGKGNDLLGGGHGDDLLKGGPGTDYFSFYPDDGDDVILDFGNGEDKIVLTAFEDIQSVADLILQQQGDNLVIDLSRQGGGTITLQDYNEADLMDAHFAFFTDDSATAA